MNLKISNKDKLDRWMNERMNMGRNMVAVQGPAHEGATYDDGDAIKRDVNIAWQDCTTGEIFTIEYNAE